MNESGLAGRRWLPGLLLLAVVVVGLLLAEWMLILRYGSSEGLVRAEGFNSPFLYTRAPGISGANRLGILRNEETAADPAGNGLRVLSYGDSIGSGYGLDAGEIYAAHLERGLRAQGPTEVLSMARGHSPSAYAFHLRADLPRLDPDAVLVVIELSNDVSDEARVRTRGSDADGLPTELRAYRYALSWDDQLLAPVGIGLGSFERTRLYYAVSRLVGRAIGRLRVPPAFREESDTFFYALSSDRFLLGDEALEQGFDRLFEVLAGMQRLLEREQTRFAIALLPSRHAFEDGHRYRLGALRLLERAETRAAELRLPLISLLDQLAADGGAILYQDFCHPTAEGHRSIARGLEPVVAGWRSAVVQGGPGPKARVRRSEE